MSKRSSKKRRKRTPKTRGLTALWIDYGARKTGKPSDWEKYKNRGFYKGGQSGPVRHVLRDGKPPAV